MFNVTAAAMALAIAPTVHATAHIQPHVTLNRHHAVYEHVPVRFRSCVRHITVYAVSERDPYDGAYGTVRHGTAAVPLTWADSAGRWQVYDAFGYSCSTGKLVTSQSPLGAFTVKR